MVLVFDYHQIGKRFLPIIPVKIGGGGIKLIETEAYVDSGAGFSAFHTAIAELAGIDYKKGGLVYPKVTAGHIKAHKVAAELAIGSTKFKCSVLFSKGLMTRFNLLGLKGVFDNFKLTFDNKKKKLTFEEN